MSDTVNRNLTLPLKLVDPDKTGCQSQTDQRKDFQNEMTTQRNCLVTISDTLRDEKRKVSEFVVNIKSP